MATFRGLDWGAAAITFEFEKMVGGPGFEPGASRTRNLRGFVHRARFRGFWAQFEPSQDDPQPVSSTEFSPDYYMNYYMRSPSRSAAYLGSQTPFRLRSGHARCRSSVTAAPTG